MTTVLQRFGITPVRAAHLRRVARVWVLASTLGTIGAVAVRALTAGATAHDWEPPVWAVTITVVVIAAGVMWVADATTAAWLGLIAVVWGISLSAHYGPITGALPVIGFAPPAILLVLAWQRLRTPRTVLVFLIVSCLVLAAGGYAASAVYGAQYGPTHPASATPAFPDSPVVWMWAGAATEDGFTVVAELDDPGPAALEVTTGDGSVTVDAVAVGDPPVARFVVTGLQPDTRYPYRIRAAGGAGPDGVVATFPSGPASLRIVFSSCARVGSNGQVFDAIRLLDPDLYLVTGDLFYADIGPNDPDAFVAEYRTALTRPAQAALYRSVPVGYMWDDHDFAQNDADASAPSRPAAMAVYRALAPHYPLSGGDDPIDQAFTIGRVRVVMSDTRSARTGDRVLTDAQVAWLAEEFAAAAAAGQLVLWVNPDPWIAPAEEGADHWGGYPEQREEIARIIADSGVDLVMLGGDAHMVAIDDGTHNTYAGGPGFVVFHAGALDRPGSLKGGPYSHGAAPGGGQFGVIDITDDGTAMQVVLRGLDWEGTTLVAHAFTVGGGDGGG